LEDMARAVRLARSAMGLISENIGLVAIPNTVGMLLATAGRLNPLSATLISNGSTIVAGVNPLRPLAGMPHEPRWSPATDRRQRYIVRGWRSRSRSPPSTW